jgi:FixJ family two-component response regulator
MRFFAGAPCLKSDDRHKPASRGQRNYRRPEEAAHRNLDLIHITISAILNFAGAKVQGRSAMPSHAKDRAIVHVVDDDASMRDALGALFDSVGLHTKTYAAAQDFLVTSLADKPGCIVIDIRLPDMNGLDFQARLTEMGVRLPVVMMTGYGDIPMSVRAMKRGAVDFLSKPFHDQDMLDAVMAAIQRDQQRRTADEDISQIEQRFASLSPREQQVMLLVAAGKMNKQVAGDLGISEITVKIHRGAAMRKMGARSLADLVRMADAVRTKR